MFRHYSYLLGACLSLMVGCGKVVEPEGPVMQSKVPDDRLAVYLVHGISENLMYKELPVDSIRLFGERLVEYQEIEGYDTVYFAFTLHQSAIERINKANNTYLEWCLPFAVVCEGEVIFGAYLYHPQSSFFPYWFYATAVRQKKFTIYAPVWTSHPIDRDPRKDPRMVKVLVEDDKIREPEFVR